MAHIKFTEIVSVLRIDRTHAPRSGKIPTYDNKVPSTHAKFIFGARHTYKEIKRN